MTPPSPLFALLLALGPVVALFAAGYLAGTCAHYAAHTSKHTPLFWKIGLICLLLFILFASATPLFLIFVPPIALLLFVGALTGWYRQKVLQMRLEKFTQTVRALGKMREICCNSTGPKPSADIN